MQPYSGTVKNPTVVRYAGFCFSHHAAPRPGEVHGEHYFFVNHRRIRANIGRDAFLNTQKFQVTTRSSREPLSRFWRPASRSPGYRLAGRTANS
ncbi:hypothetical protein ACNKHO_23140 [Shigella flexneri]